MDNKIVTAVHEQLALSYSQAGRVIPTNVAIIAASLQDALQFNDVEEVHNAFRRARDMADIPTQRVLKDALTNHRRENLPQPTAAIVYEKDKPVTFEQKQYMFATSSLCGILPATIPNAREIITDFERDPKNEAFAKEQRAWCRSMMAQRLNQQIGAQQ